ncbi:plasmid stabilization system protein ParE [Neorhizobium galegae]|uniref:type II toxin-antitoxin system RelE/ParE family toxin n=1 Tax=Rhizobium/Agrobacterium group TaxID=227290 RepID=UPI001AE7EDB1|nr:type II toxin-antitoxin system RelE/ParE family toxin [Neorhizobium galegae]MBP2547519.1 plasmid stabilization system protein ParE [Neorhizobium galegae]
MRTLLSKSVRQFLRREAEYLESQNPRAAVATLQQLRESIRMIGDYPGIGAPLPLPGRRRFVSGAYVIDYRVDAKSILISHMRHGRQLDPDLERDDDLAD